MANSEDDRQWQTLFSARITGNAIFRFGVREESLSRLLSHFELSQGALYHYTQLNAAESISRGELWLTRADGFLDEQEIEHGLGILTFVIPSHWGCKLRSEYEHSLIALRDMLKKCYVLSLSLDADNAYLKEKYAGEKGAILRLPSILSNTLATGWHAVPNGDGYSLHHANDLYELIQGSVIYDLEHQKGLSAIACETFEAIASKGDASSPETILELLHFRDALLQCLILFKGPRYQDEKEYRMALILKAEVKESFEHVRDVNGRHSSYIKLRMALPNIEGGTEILGIEGANAE